MGVLGRVLCKECKRKTISWSIFGIEVKGSYVVTHYINLRIVYIFSSLQNELEVLVNEWKEDKCIGNIIINHVSDLFTQKSHG